MFVTTGCYVLDVDDTYLQLRYVTVTVGTVLVHRGDSLLLSYWEV